MTSVNAELYHREYDRERKHGQMSPWNLLCKCGDPDCEWSEAANREARREWDELTEVSSAISDVKP